MIENIRRLSFHPFPGLSSPHFQTILGSFSWAGTAPPSSSMLFSLEDGDKLCGEISVPFSWNPSQKTVIMIHGLGGSHTSNYIVRISRKLFKAGYRIVRLNLRGCGSGKNLNQLPYHAGVSNDVLQVLQTLKKDTPHSPLILVGFSLGGNIVLKLGGELGEQANALLQCSIAVCPPFDLAQTVDSLTLPSNRFYQRYYLNRLRQQGNRWLKNKTIRSLREFDDVITAPKWGYRSAAEYYERCSSRYFIPCIRHHCHILFAADDPFVNCQSILHDPLFSSVKIWLSQHGGHMGFLGWSGHKYHYFWLDSLLLQWINETSLY